MGWLVAFTSFVMFLLVANILLWRNKMSTSADLVTSATALSAAANALTATATAVEALVAQLKAGGGTGLIDQATLDSVNASLASSVTSLQASQTALQALVPPPAPAPGA
jgi:hypothetical protein